MNNFRYLLDINFTISQTEDMLLIQAKMKRLSLDLQSQISILD